MILYKDSYTICDHKGNLTILDSSDNEHCIVCDEIVLYKRDY